MLKTLGYKRNGTFVDVGAHDGETAKLGDFGISRLMSSQTCLAKTQVRGGDSEREALRARDQQTQQLLQVCPRGLEDEETKAFAAWLEPFTT